MGKLRVARTCAAFSQSASLGDVQKKAAKKGEAPKERMYERKSLGGGERSHFHKRGILMKRNDLIEVTKNIPKFLDE